MHATEQLSTQTEYADQAQVRQLFKQSLELAKASDDSVAASQTFGKACFLRSGFPCIIHVLARATSYRDANIRTLLSGGDSRKLLIVVRANGGGDAM